MYIPAMVEQLASGWWLHRDPGPLPLRLLLVGWRPAMRWEARDRQAGSDPFLRLYWNRGGGAAIEAGGRRWRLGPDRLVAILPETRHRRLSEAPSDHFFIHAAIEDPRWRLDTGVAALAVPPALRRAMQRLLIPEPDRGAVLRLAHALAASALCELPLREQALDPALALLAERIAGYTRHPGSWPGVAALAAGLGLPQRSLGRRFHQLCGTSPRRWIAMRRIDAACDLLAHGDAPIEGIAERLGYVDRFHFSRAFRAARGMPPAAYRRRSLLGSAV